MPEKAYPLPIYDNAFVTFFVETVEKLKKYYIEMAKSPTSTPKSVDSKPTTPHSVPSKQASPQQETSLIDEEVLQKFKQIIQDQDTQLSAAKKERDAAIAQLSQITSLKQQLDSLNNKYNAAMQDLQLKDSTIEEMQEAVALAQNELRTFKERSEQDTHLKVKEWQTKHNTVEKNYSSVTELLASKEQELGNLAQAYEQMQNFVTEKDEEIVKQKQTIRQQEQTIKNLDAEKQAAESKLIKLGQEQVDRSELDALQKELYAKSMQLQHAEQKTKQAITLSAQENVRYTEMEQKYQNQVADLVKKQQEQYQYVAMLQTRNAELEKFATAPPQTNTNAEQIIAQQQATISQMQAALDEAKTKSPPATISEQTYMNTAKRLSMAENRISRMEEELKQKTTQVADYEKLSIEKEKRIDDLEREALDLMDIIEKLEEKLKGK